MLANLEDSAVATGLERSYSFQSKRKAISKNVHLPHSCTHLTCYESNFLKQVLNSTGTVKFHMFNLDWENTEEPEIKLPTLLDHRKSKRIAEKHLPLLHRLCKSLWLCGLQQAVENLQRLKYQTILSAFWEICMQVKKQQRELNMEQTGSKSGKEYVKAVYCHPDYLN